MGETDTQVVIGLMSGTSCDGVDAAALALRSPDTPHTPKVLGHVHLPFEAPLQHRLLQPERLSVRDISRLHVELPALYAQAVRQLPSWERATSVAMHGQTLWHEPPSRLTTLDNARANTLQIGSSAALATEIGLPVVGDLRGADVALGGEGAPIVPFAHWFFSGGEDGLMVVNVGGIANATYVRGQSDAVEAADLGPGMMLVDALCRLRTDGRADYDHDGELSRDGQLHPEVMAFVATHPFFARARPRTTGREDFGEDFAAALANRFSALRTNDLLTSVLAATAAVILDGAAQATAPVRRILLTGGGALNPTLLARLAARAAPVPVERALTGVFAPPIHEPASMALLGARCLARLPSALPRVTGARRAAVLGHIHHP